MWNLLGGTYAQITMFFDPLPPLVRFLNREKVDFIGSVRFWLDPLLPPVSVRTLWMVPSAISEF